jgi:hypothetical protein
VRKIELTQGRVALVDDCDFDWLSQWNWYFANGYAVRGERHPEGKSQMILMHRVIMNAPDGMHVDHINGDGLDNRRSSNLRLCNHSQNQANRGPSSNSRSGIKGVWWHHQKWQAAIKIDGRTIHLGYFDHAADAAAAYDQAAIKYHGEFAQLNNIDRYSFDLQQFNRLVLATSSLCPAAMHMTTHSVIVKTG